MLALLAALSAALSACHQAGFRPGGRVTFFASPKKVTKERRPRMRRPLRGFLAVLGLRVHCETRCAKAPLKHVAMSQLLKRAARATLNPALLSASYGDLNPNTNTTRLACGIASKPVLARCASQLPPDAEGEAGLCSGPVRRAEERRVGGGVRSTLQQLTHRNCLSGAQRSEFCDAPPDRAPQGTLRAAKGAPSGSPFFWFLFFGEAKKRDSAVGTTSRRSLAQ